MAKWFKPWTVALEVSEFNLQSCYRNHFQETYESLYLPRYGLNCITAVFFTKIALALNYPQRLICHKTKPN